MALSLVGSQCLYMIAFYHHSSKVGEYGKTTGVRVLLITNSNDGDYEIAEKMKEHPFLIAPFLNLRRVRVMYCTSGEE